MFQRSACLRALALFTRETTRTTSAEKRRPRPARRDAVPKRAIAKLPWARPAVVF